MTLTDAQIDRYSRQIIVPHIGGRGQQRLLAARIVLAGDARDIAAPLAYLVGAGVGAIDLRMSGEQGDFIEKIDPMRELNPEVSVTLADQSNGRVDLALLIIGSTAALKAAEEITNDLAADTLVIARLDAPGKIAVIPATHNARTLDASMLADVGPRSEASEFIAMLATAEAFKLLAGFAETPASAFIEFDGYKTSVRVHR
jgi:hypothetical protein